MGGLPALLSLSFVAKATSSKTQLPRVFVGSPYGGAFNFKQFRRALNALPFRLVYAKDHLDTKHILTNCTTLIKRADFCLFDISTWNPNVTLELGLAEGMGVKYYILCRKSQAKEVPTDLKGIQHIEYAGYPLWDARGRVVRTNLWYQVASRLAVKDRLLKSLWGSLGRRPDADKCRMLAFRLLAGLRDHSSLPRGSVDSYARGMWLQADGKQAALKCLTGRNLVHKGDRIIRLTRRLFRPE